VMDDRAVIPFGKKIEGVYSPPHSKSHAIRTLLVASLAKGGSVITSPGSGEDVGYMKAAVGKWRSVRETGDSLVIKESADIAPPPGTYFAGGSAAAMRFLLALFSLLEGERVIDGDGFLRRRPVGAGIGIAEELGAEVEPLGVEGFLPVSVRGKTWRASRIRVADKTSSQFISGMLMAGPLTRGEFTVEIERPVSLPYILMTVETMKRFGVEVEVDGNVLTVPRGDYRGAAVEIEKDYSSASNFLCAAAATGGKLEVMGLPENSIQGDRKVVDVIRSCGVDISWKNGILVCGGAPSKPLDVDIKDHPDLFPPLAVLAMKCPGVSVFRGTGRLEAKESARGSAIAGAIDCAGGRTFKGDDMITIEPAERYRGALLDPEGDHRLAMAFAVMGLIAGGTSVICPSCVKKSYPAFWPDFFNILK